MMRVMTQENESAEKASLTDSTKLEICEEVKRQFGNPPKTFVDLVESEVQKRIRRQEWFYWTILGLFTLFAATYGALFWHKQLSEIPKAVQEQLATQGVMALKTNMMNILVDAESKQRDLNNISISASNLLVSVSTNQQAFMDRLNQIKQQDNVVLLDKDGRLRLHSPVFLNAPIFFETDNAYIEFTKGGSIVCGAPTDGPTSLHFLPDGQVELDYMNGTNWARILLNRRH